ncbi:cyanophycinase [Hymenobacter properus]|uniref:Cyanophycinase n=1 Tax=Hymenobacter properus TaxID=2791026 RepID=A0A931FMK3_9BACT|nr:cyanophycinase [Hymenobacter properus]MBF9141764.1 cyanophycinase [Hymenobacter properus]MBR7720573.1 cyanophycinase [Microvirga sp. SRT04]
MPSRKTKTHPKKEAESTCLPPKGILIAIGGHEDKSPAPGTDPEAEYAPDSILRRFVSEVGPNKNILIVPIASEEPKAAAKDYLDLFNSLEAGKVDVLDLQNREQAHSEEALRQLEEADGFMFTGGDQLRLTALLGGTPWLRRLKERFTHEEIVIAGTSAGAAAMSTPMIYQGRDNQGMLKDEIHVTTGLQFVHDVAIDTHFVARGRIIRMAQIIATNPGCIGLGLEEDTAVVIRDGRELEVIGSGVVTVVDGQDCTDTNIHRIKSGEAITIRDLRVHILSCGEFYTLPVQEDMHR